MFLHLSVILFWGGVQAQAEGGVCPGGCPGPCPGGVQAQARGCIPACTEADTPQQMVTAADGMHPTGMHSCWMKYLPPATCGNIMFPQMCVIPSVHKGGGIPACNGQEGVYPSM